MQATQATQATLKHNRALEQLRITGRSIVNPTEQLNEQTLNLIAQLPVTPNPTQMMQIATSLDPFEAAELSTEVEHFSKQCQCSQLHCHRCVEEADTAGAIPFHQ